MKNYQENWPRKGDKLFCGDLPDGQHNVCIGYIWENVANWNAYVDGYKEAADLLVAAAVENRGTLDLLVFPTVYLYRHHFEIALKTIILLGRRFRGEEQKAPTGYDLKSLWKEVRRVFEARWGKDDQSSLDVVESCVEELSGFDPYGEGFRYPYDKKQENRHLDGLTHINVRNLSEVAGRVSCFLTCCIIGLWIEVDQKEDYLIDMANDMEEMFGQDEY